MMEIIFSTIPIEIINDKRRRNIHPKLDLSESEVHIPPTLAL